MGAIKTPASAWLAPGAFQNLNRFIDKKVMTMKTNSPKTNWILEAILLIGFFIEFALDWSGLSLHQWLGVFGGLLAVYHLVTHWDWLMAVSLRFFGKTSGQARTYLVLDLALMLGFYLIVMSGLLISTWLNLALTNYPAWVNFHIITSLVTLGLVVFKIGLHWRWIVRVARQSVFAPAPPPPAPALRPAPVVAPVTRRDFLKLMGIVGVASVLAFSSALKGVDELENAAAAAEPAAATGEAGTSSTATATSPAAAPSATVAETVPTAAPTAVTENINVVESQPVVTNPAVTTACNVRCNKGCSAPGRCRRYQDTTGNNRCDLGECL